MRSGLTPGSVRMQGDAFRVVKAFEEDLHGPIQRLTTASAPAVLVRAPDAGLSATTIDAAARQRAARVGYCCSNPNSCLIPCRFPCPTCTPDDAAIMHHQAPGGVSRWHSEIGLKITGFSIIARTGRGTRYSCCSPLDSCFFSSRRRTARTAAATVWRCTT